jgi:hypothetical protein
MVEKNKLQEKMKAITIALLFIFSASLIPIIGIANSTDDPIVDDCITTEVEVSEIISPASIVNTGKHEITADFSTIGIIINGQFDQDPHEPWMEHPSSPDDNGTPPASYYTSCDEYNMYIAFQAMDESEPIIGGELFIDINHNDIWDMADIFLEFFEGDDKVYEDSNPISDSNVGWGDIIEIQIPKTIWNDCNNWGFRIRSTPCTPSDPCLVALPDEGDIITEYIAYDQTVDSYFDITLDDIPIGEYDIEEITYSGWCIEYGDPHSPTQLAIAYSSICDLPGYITIPPANWSKVNYILNHKNGKTINQIQRAIWEFANLGSSDPGTPDAGAQQLIDDANANGAGFIPSGGQIIAVILANPYEQLDSYQHTIIEVIVPDTDCDWNPHWGNNTHPSATPPDNQFLTFDCTYWYDCECGISFKALANIWKIHPGECHNLYTTDFENETANDLEWIAKSLDPYHTDTWNLSTLRKNSGSNSYHCTINTNYYGNQYDVLEMKNGLDLKNVINVSVSFMHWCEGDSYEDDGSTHIMDYGEVEFYAPLDGIWTWIPLKDLSLTSVYYDNDWEEVSFTIDRNTVYNLSGTLINGSDLLQDGNKIRFVWISSPQFQYEGWYIDDITIEVCENEYYDPIEDLIYQSQSIGPEHWCAYWNSTLEKTFPLLWNITKEGKYLLNVSLQEEPPWCGQSWLEKIIIVGNIYDVAVIEIDPPAIVSPGDDVNFSAIIKNVGTMDNLDITVTATLKKDGQGPAIKTWQQTIENLDVGDESTLYFIWDDATYCDYKFEVTAIIDGEEDANPSDNSDFKWLLVSDTIFIDHINDDLNWEHMDLTGGPGHWVICTSGYNKYLWCGDLDTTLYDHNWNDIAQINQTFNLADNNTVSIKFQTQYQINSPGDFGIVEWSKDGGQHWEQFPTSPLFTGDHDWTTVQYTKDISAEDITKAQFRFRFTSNETIKDRGWIIDYVKIIVDGTEIFMENFTAGITNKWIIERARAGDWWQRVIKDKPDDIGNMAWWCGDTLTSMYPHNLNNALTLTGPTAAEIDLTKSFGADLLFNTWYDIDEGDMGYVEISKNSGSSWTTVHTITGDSDGWILEWIDLDAYLGDIITIRFRFTSNNAGALEGWYIDDVQILAKIDENPPESTHIISGTMGLNDWYTSTVQITLSATDDYSGVDKITYSLNGGTPQTYSTSITINTDGTHTVEYWAVDNVGNIEASHFITLKRDATKPENLEITKPINGLYIRDNRLWPLINFSIFSWSPPIIFGKITIQVSCMDTTSGMKSVEFNVNNLTSTDTTIPYEWLWDERAFFTHTITVIAEDNAGNTDTVSKDVRIFNLGIF